LSDKALVWKLFMPRFYQPDLGSELDGPFARDANNKLVRRGYSNDNQASTGAKVLPVTKVRVEQQAVMATSS
jgi:hypothetical protein